MFGGLGLEIKRAGDVDFDAIDDDELIERVVELARHRSQLEAIEAETLAAYDRRRAWAASGAKSAVADLGYRTRQSKVECKARLATARALRELPVAAEAWRTGDITAEHLRVLSRACTARTAELLARDEAMLVEQAKVLRFDRWAKVVAYWSLHADPDGATAADLERKERRHLSVVDLSDRVTISGMLDLTGGETFSEELRRLEQQLFDADWAGAKARLGRDPLVQELERTGAQRRADALVEMAVRSAGSRKRARASISVVMGPQAFGWLCELEASGRPIAPGALLGVLDDATVEAVLFENGEREVRLSRKRLFEGAVRRVIELRGDRECFHPTCDETAVHCEGDHIKPWSLGGLTAHWNGRPGCGYHNRHRGPP